MRRKLRIALAGAGLIGRRHVEILRGLDDEFALASIVDPSENGRDYAGKLGVNHYPDLSEMFRRDKPDGVLIATPNQVHVENGLECVAHDCPMLIEKPVATTCQEALRLIRAADKSGIPVLVGHHRRHNPLMQQAHALVKSGSLGDVTSVQGTCWFLKPEEYFAPEWRRQDGAGPIMVNAIHDIDLIRFLCGDVASVYAVSSNKVRGFETEDSAVIILKFSSGALGTFNISDTIAAPWSWEMTSGENPDFSITRQNCYMIGGTKASLSIPDVRLWRHEGEGHWKQPINSTAYPKDNTDPLVRQMRHFGDVILGDAEPIVSGAEGMESLKVLESIKKSALSGRLISL